VLAPAGGLIIKIFQGGDEAQILDRMKESFSSVKIFKPKASKKASMEIYFLGFDYRKKKASG